VLIDGASYLATLGIVVGAAAAGAAGSPLAPGSVLAAWVVTGDDSAGAASLLPVLAAESLLAVVSVVCVPLLVLPAAAVLLSEDARPLFLLSPGVDFPAAGDTPCS
jgi:hypothetical protein